VLHWPLLQQLSRAGEWFLRSGIQDPNGGVARYYRTDLQRNHTVSTEITGYTLSALLYLHSLTGDERYLHRAVLAGHFLAGTAWDAASCVLPFELDPPDRAYFFDCGIVVRGLIALWRATGTREFLAVAALAGDAMSRDFAAPDGEFHPVLVLPEKQPMPRDPLRWSLSPGCYQLKAALAWRELADATGDAGFRGLYERFVAHIRGDAATFLPGHAEPRRVMDRLHAYLYFLEGLLPCGDRATIHEGIVGVAGYLRQIEPEFARSDVFAQLLRLRLYADSAGVEPLDRAAARNEAQNLAEFQVSSEDSRVDGGFYFGRSDGAWLPYVNPVSTAFALQALALWQENETHPRAYQDLI
jgi:hypothetical protein